MVEIPQKVMELLNDDQAAKTLATVSSDGKVHAIRVGSAVAPSKDLVAVGAIFMSHTCDNLETMKKKGQLASILVNKEMEAYEIKAKVKDYQTSGPLYDKMAQEVKKLGLSVKGVWTFEPVEVWNQSASPHAGEKMA